METIPCSKCGELKHQFIKVYTMTRSGLLERFWCLDCATKIVISKIVEQHLIKEKTNG